MRNVEGSTEVEAVRGCAGGCVKDSIAMIAISARIWSFNLVALAILVMSSTFVDFEKFSKKMEKDKSWSPDGIKKEWERFKENPLIKKDADPSTGIIRMQIPDLVVPPQARTPISSAEAQTIFN